jgi:hypothetical protein
VPRRFPSRLFHVVEPACSEPWRFRRVHVNEPELAASELHANAMRSIPRQRAEELDVVPAPD